jgi:glycosyltransferase involved in cell wall biosynthesis
MNATADHAQRRTELPSRAGAAARRPRLDIVIPVLNEERSLARAVETLHRHLDARFEVPYRVTIADNGSSDATPQIAASLARIHPWIRVLTLEQKGRGRALRAAWSTSDADVVAYMDVDLSTDLEHLRALVGPLLEGRADIVVGSRLAPGAVVARGRKREIISRGYNMLLGLSLAVGFSDAQCGFKAARREVVDLLLPLVEDEGWFFDTELLYLAQRNAYSIREVPVRWTDDSDSRVAILRTALEDLRGIRRLRRRTRDGSDRIAGRGVIRTQPQRVPAPHRLGAAH